MCIDDLHRENIQCYYYVIRRESGGGGGYACTIIVGLANMYINVYVIWVGSVDVSDFILLVRVVRGVDGLIRMVSLPPFFFPFSLATKLGG